jgi:hypothetical protein
MMRQMCWLSRFGNTEEKVLHLRTAPNEPWQPYTAFPQYVVPDYPLPGGSKGWATAQKLMQADWVLIPSATEKATDSVSREVLQEQALAPSASDAGTSPP